MVSRSTAAAAIPCNQNMVSRSTAAAAIPAGQPEYGVDWLPVPAGQPYGDDSVKHLAGGLVRGSQQRSAFPSAVGGGNRCVWPRSALSRAGLSARESDGGTLNLLAEQLEREEGEAGDVWGKNFTMPKQKG